MRRCLGVLLGLLIAGFTFAGPALAHATVVKTDPADGARLKAVPKTVTVTFDENVGLGSIGYLHVTDQTGKRVDTGRAYHPNGNGIEVADNLKSGLGNGSYTASWRVISADSHPVAGSIAFVVGNGALVRQHVSGSTTDQTTGVAFDVSRWISYAGLALLGGSWLLLTVWPEGRDDRRARRIAWTGWGAASAGAVLETLLQGPYAAGGGLAKIADWSYLDDTLHSQYGQLHCVRLVLLGALGLLFARSLQTDARPARWEAVAGVLGIAVAWTFSDVGHAATTSPSWLSICADMLHLLSMAIWIGGLVMLVAAVLPRREPDELHAVLPVFSTVAFTAVVVLGASGLYAAWRGIGTVDAIFTTTYGLLVVTKIALFLGLLALANFSRRQVQRRTIAYAMTDTALVEDVDTGTALATEKLRRSVLVEAGIGLIVLAVTAVLVAEPRGKEALLASYREPVSASAALGGGRTVTVTADPGTHGLVDVTVELSPGTAPKQVTATATQQQKQLGPIPIKLARERANLYDGSANLPAAGAWDVDLVVTTSAIDQTTTDVTIDLH